MTSNKNKNKDLTSGSISKHMARLAVPSIGGMLAITIFNITDTYFVSKLGVVHLAAMGFTFPVVMIIGSISSGIAIGAGSLLARAMGRKDYHLMHRIATDGILLAIVTVMIFAVAGILTMKPVFTLLGADSVTLPLIMDYMLVWYLGIGVVLMPPVSDSCMRGMGDMIRPSLVMITCAVLNVILDPIFIFGKLGVPAMGIQGAAIATVISRFAGMLVSLGFVHFKYKLLDFRYKSYKELFESWWNILAIGIPSAIVRVLPQTVRALITSRAAAVGGLYAVAAVAAGGKIESFATVISMAVGVSLVPMIGQNWGANRLDRVHKIRHLTNRIALYYGVVLFGLSLVFSDNLAHIFNDNIEVVKYIQIYLGVVTLASMGLNTYNWTSEMLNAAGKPKWSLNINLLGTLVVLIPLIILGSLIAGFIGMLIGLGIGQILVGIYARQIGKRQLSQY
ncbi:MAG: MATE family efflux transporter [Vallitaleaceae bacterium]|nr:MATE family efflux transporter [Vallitaleaceae bacterium]